jgi:molecular chaperone GrpE (heat shock protein)
MVGSLSPKSQVVGSFRSDGEGGSKEVGAKQFKYDLYRQVRANHQKGHDTLIEVREQLKYGSVIKEPETFCVAVITVDNAKSTPFRIEIEKGTRFPKDHVLPADHDTLDTVIQDTLIWYARNEADPGDTIQVTTTATSPRTPQNPPQGVSAATHEKFVSKPRVESESSRTESATTSPSGSSGVAQEWVEAGIKDLEDNLNYRRTMLEDRVKSLEGSLSKARMEPTRGTSDLAPAGLEALRKELEKHREATAKEVSGLRESQDSLRAELEALRARLDAGAPAESSPTASSMSGGEMVQVLAHELEGEVSRSTSALREVIHAAFKTVVERLGALDKLVPLPKGKRADAIETLVADEVARRVGLVDESETSASARVAGFVRALVRIPDIEGDISAHFGAPITTRVRTMVNEALRDDPKPAVIEACRAVVEACGLELIYPKPGDSHEPARFRMESLERGTVHEPDRVCRVIEPGYQDGKKVLQQAVVVVSQ